MLFPGHRIAVNRRRPDSQGVVNPRKELVDVGFDAGADVEDIEALVAEGRNIGLDDISDEDVVPSLLPVSVDHRLLVTEELVHEDCDHAGLAVGVLARPEDVGIPEAGHTQSVLAVVEIQVALAGQLGNSIGGNRTNGVVFIGRMNVLFAINCAACGRKDDLLYSGLPCRLKKVEQAEQIDIGVKERVLHRPPYIHLGCVVDQNVYFSIVQELGSLI